MSKKVLVAYATSAGSTAEVADAIGKELSRDGLRVDTKPVQAVKDIGAYDWVIVGGPVILAAWHPGAVEFLNRHGPALSRIPVAYFFTGMHLMRTGETHWNGIPLDIDPNLLTAPKKPGHLSFTERYATVEHYLGPVLQAEPSIKPVSVGFFAGKMDYARLKLPQRFFATFVARMQPGDWRNWEAIRNWAHRLPMETLHDQALPAPG